MDSQVKKTLSNKAIHRTLVPRASNLFVGHETITVVVTTSNDAIMIFNSRVTFNS